MRISDWSSDLCSSDLLSPAPTLERVRKLENNGYIKNYHAAVNEEALGFGIKTFIQITVNLNMPDSRNNFIRKISEIDEVVECYHVTGESDFLLKVIVQDMHAFEVLVLEKFSKIDEINHQASMMVIPTVKKNAVLPMEERPKERRVG